MGRTKIVAGLMVPLALCGCSSIAGHHTLTVGSKNFTEQVLLGEIIARHIEHRLHQKVDRRLNLGGTLLAHQALVSGEIDLYPEYTGTALAAILKQSSGADPAAVLAHVRSEYARRFRIEWLDPLGIDNTFVMVIRGSEARANHMDALTDAAKAAQGWALGVGYEFEQRADGMAALQAAYHLPMRTTPRSMDLGLLYKAIEQNQVDMIAANATDGLLSKMDLKVLRDDKHAFPPYEVCIAVRQEQLQETPALRAALLELSGKFSNQSMRELNYEVDGRHIPMTQVAAEFLNRTGLR